MIVKFLGHIAHWTKSLQYVHFLPRKIQLACEIGYSAIGTRILCFVTVCRRKLWKFRWPPWMLFWSSRLRYEVTKLLFLMLANIMLSYRCGYNYLHSCYLDWCYNISRSLVVLYTDAGLQFTQFPPNLIYVDTYTWLIKSQKWLTKCCVSWETVDNCLCYSLFS